MTAKMTLREFFAYRLGKNKIPYTVIEGVIYEIGHGGRWVDVIRGLASLNVRSLTELDFKDSPTININSTDPNLQLRLLSDAFDERDV